MDTTLSDGSHSMFHQYSSEQITNITQALAKAKIDTIEVTHGDGLGGSSIQYGFSKLTDQEALQAAAKVLEGSKLADEPAWKCHDSSGRS